MTAEWCVSLALGLARVTGGTNGVVLRQEHLVRTTVEAFSALFLALN